MGLCALLLLELGARGLERLLPTVETMRDVTEVRVFEPVPGDPAWVRTAPDLRLRLDRATWVYPDQRFARAKPPGTVRVALLGGSNVFRLHAFQDRLQAAVAAALGDGRAVEVLNGGGNAQGSRGVLHVGRELLAFEPDVLVLYTGHNEQAEATVLRMLTPGPLVHVAVARLLTRAWTAALSGRRQAATAKALADVEAAAPRPGTVAPSRRALPPLPPADLPTTLPEQVQRYRDNLTTIVDEAQAAGVRVVIATVATNLRRPLLLDPDSPFPERIEAAYRAGRLDEGMALAEEALASTTQRLQSGPLEDAVLRGLAASRGATLADVAEAVRAAEPHGVPGETLFTDRCHLTPEGYALWVDVVAPAVASALVP